MPTPPCRPRPSAPRTADCVVPTPTMAPVMVCVVDTGMPACAVKNSVAAAAVSALIPPTGCSLVIREPMVFTIRQPPKASRARSPSWADSTTHSGTGAFTGTTFAPISTARMTPIVFCASLAPCPRLKAAAETS